MALECSDRLLRWDVTPCLCDCHYTGRECAGMMPPRRSGAERRTLIRRPQPVGSVAVLRGERAEWDGPIEEVAETSLD